MTKSHHPYSQLVDPETTRARSLTGLRRTIGAVLVVGLVAIVIAVGVIVGLVALVYLLKEPPTTASEVLRSTSSRPGSAAGEPSAELTPVGFAPLLERLASLEQEVASLKRQCRSCHLSRNRGPTSQQPLGTEPTYLESATVSLPQVQDATRNVAANSDLATVPINTDHGSPKENESPQNSPLTSIQDSPSGTPSAGPPSSAAQSASVEPKLDPSVPELLLQPKSRDRRKAHGRRDREDAAEDPVRQGRDGRDDSEARAERKKERKREGRRSASCRHCIDNDRPVSLDDDTATVANTFQAPAAVGRAAHIQGNRNGNIHINNDGWVRGPKTWKMAEWTDNSDHYFTLNVLGTVTVREAGLYYVYSQVLFYDPNDTVGQSIYINDEPRFTCTKSNISAEAKQSTCYVGGVVRLAADDRVRIRLSVPSVTIALYADTSYFGLFRVA